MVRRSWIGVAALVGVLLGCAGDPPLGTNVGGGGGEGGGDPTLNPARFTATVNPTPPPGYRILDEAPYQWQAYFYDDGAWVAAGRPQVTDAPRTVLVIDCNDPGIRDACLEHRSAMIQVTVTRVSPGPALLCAYKVGFQFLDDFLLNTPVGTLSLAPAASSGLDPANRGTCFP